MSEPWYSVLKEEELVTPESPGDEQGSGDEQGPFVSHHPSRRFANVLSQLRATFPEVSSASTRTQTHTHVDFHPQFWCRQSHQALLLLGQSASAEPATAA